MASDARPIAFIDVETTGTWPGKHELLEVGAVVASGEVPFAVTDSFELKIKPSRLSDADPEALRINRYTEEEWRDALPEDAAVREFCRRVSGVSLWGWNVGFDRAFLEPALNRAGLGLETCNLDYTWYDLKMEFRRWAILVGREAEFSPRFSLGSARRCFSIGNEDAHRALSDALATYQVFVRLSEEFGRLAQGSVSQASLF